MPARCTGRRLSRGPDPDPDRTSRCTASPSLEPEVLEVHVDRAVTRDFQLELQDHVDEAALVCENPRRSGIVRYRHRGRPDTQETSHAYDRPDHRRARMRRCARWPACATEQPLRTRPPPPARADLYPLPDAHPHGHSDRSHRPVRCRARHPVRGPARRTGDAGAAWTSTPTSRPSLAVHGRRGGSPTPSRAVADPVMITEIVQTELDGNASQNLIIGGQSPSGSRMSRQTRLSRRSPPARTWGRHHGDRRLRAGLGPARS